MKDTVFVTTQASGYTAGPTGNFPVITLTPGGPRRLLLIHMSWFIIPGSEADLPTVDGSSAGIFQIGSTQTINSDRDRHAVYGLLDPPTQSLTVTATIADANTNALVIGAVAYAGVNPVQAMMTPAQQIFIGGTALSLTPPGPIDPGALVVSSMRARNPTPSATHGQTVDWEFNGPGGALFAAAMTHTQGSPSTMTHTLADIADAMQTALVILPSGQPFRSRVEVRR